MSALRDSASWLRGALTLCPTNDDDDDVDDDNKDDDDLSSFLDGHSINY